MPAPRGSASFGSSKIIISTTRLVGDTRGSQNAGGGRKEEEKKRKWRRTCKESRPRFNIFHSFSSGDAIFEGGCPSSLSPPLSPSHRGGSLTSTLLAMTSIHRPTAPRTRSYNLLFRTTFYAHRGRKEKRREEKKKKKEAAVLVASVWGTSERQRATATRFMQTSCSYKCTSLNGDGVHGVPSDHLKIGHIRRTYVWSPHYNIRSLLYCILLYAFACQQMVRWI